MGTRCLGGETTRVDFQHLICGLALLCPGDNKEEKIRCLFEAFDFDEVGLATAADLVQLIYSTAKLKYACMPDAALPPLMQVATDLIQTLLADTGLDMET